MKDFFKDLAPVLAISDLTMIIAMDGDNCTIVIKPKAKEGKVDFPSLNFSGNIEKFDENFGKSVDQKLTQQMPLISNIPKFEKAFQDMEKAAKEKLTPKAKAATPAAPKKPNSPIVEKAEKNQQEEDLDEEEDVENANTIIENEELAPVSEETKPEQPKLF